MTVGLGFVIAAKDKKIETTMQVSEVISKAETDAICDNSTDLETQEIAISQTDETMTAASSEQSAAAKHVVRNNCGEFIEYDNDERNADKVDVTTASVSKDVLSGYRDEGVYIGHLTVPSVGIAVNVYYGQVVGDLGNPDNQAIVNAQNSACAAKGLPGEPAPVIVNDHNNQGFSVIADIQVGDVLTIVTPYGQYNYKCYRVTDATLNADQTDYVDANGQSVTAGTNGGVILKTCIENWKHDEFAMFYPCDGNTVLQ